MKMHKEKKIMITFNELLERANSEKIAIHTPTKEQAITLLTELKKRGYTWFGGEKLTITHYRLFRENTCYDFGICNYPYMDKVVYNPLGWYQKYGFTIIEFADIDFKENKNMKYIRTKDGKIYEVVGEKVNGIRLYSWQLEDINKNKGNFYFDGKNICEKVADTIEELCDAYVCIVSNYDPVYCSCLSRLKASWESCTEKERKLRRNYGAIWTDKGLIYVAKMNEKGNWELI